MPQNYIKISVLFLWALSSCRPEAFEFPDTPVLRMDKPPEQYTLNGKDSAVRLYIQYSDGDGDIGLEPGDTAAPFQFGSPFFYNLFIRVYAVENGVGRQIPIPMSNDTVNFNDRIRNLTPSGRNKSIYGEITLNLKAQPYPGISPDSMYYTIQIADRSLKLSNIIQTPVMGFRF